MINKKYIRITLCLILTVLAIFAFSACSGTAELESEIERLERKVEELEAAVSRLTGIANIPNASNSREHTHVPRDCDGNCLELILPEMWAEISGVDRFTLAYAPESANPGAQGEIRVFENGNANVRLFADGTFIANLFHNTKITGTYTEMTDGREIAVLFTYGGINNMAGGVGTFEATGSVTVVGGILDGVLTIPIDWDDGHGHGMDFAYRAYPLVFIGENNQNITLFADNTFELNLAGDVRVIGFYGIRATSVTFVPGSPTFDRNGNPVGTFLLAELRTCRDVPANNPGDDDDCEFYTGQVGNDPHYGLEWCDDCQMWK